MQTSLRRWTRFFPAFDEVSAAARVRICCGVAIGVAVSGLVSRLLIGDEATLLVLVPPMGASAILLFAAPASRIAQPWPLVAGHFVSALIGVTAARWIPDPMLASGAAVGCALAAMFALRCVHYPSGAVAVIAVVGGPAVTGAGYTFVFVPVMINALLLLLAALAFHRLVGTLYPVPDGERADPRDD